MKDKKYSELLVISNIKKTILYFDNILINFPRKDYILKNKIELILYDLLEDIYMANYLFKNERINKLFICLTKIKMLDFYINICFKKKIISYKKFINLCSILNNIVKLIYGFINYEKSK